MTILGRLRLGLLCLFGLTVLQGVLAGLGTHALRQVTDRLGEDVAAVDHAQRALLAFERADRAAQEAMRTAEPEQARRLAEQFRAELTTLRAELRDAGGGAPTGGDPFAALAPALGGWEQHTDARLPGSRRGPQTSLLRDDVLADQRDAMRAEIDAAVRRQVVAAATRRAEATVTAIWVQASLLAAAAVALGFGVWLARRLGRQLSGAFADAIDVANRVAGGDLRTPIRIGAADERGALLAALARMRDQLLERQAAETRQLDAAEGRAAELRTRTGAFEQAAGRLVTTLAEDAEGVRVEAAQLAEGGAMVGRLSASAAAGASRTTAEVDGAAATIDRLVQVIDTVRGVVERGSAISGRAAGAAAATEQRIATLTDTTRQIGEVSRLIASIAAQTNLLALNASIEAARAGDAGKGFAVVAAEVKALAAHTARATEDIAEGIGRVQGETEAARIAVVGMVEVSRELLVQSQELAEGAALQSREMRAIADATRRTAELVGGINGSAAQVSAQVSDQGRSAESLRGTAASLAGRAEEMRGTVSDFLRQLRAA